MPKLSSKKADEIGASGDGGFEPLPEDLYTAKLQAVEAKESAAGNVYWRWEYRISDGDFKGRLLWDNTSLSDAAAWRLKKVFDAFGVPLDTDTDELLGRTVQLSVSQRVIEKGNRAGEIGNNVESILPGVELGDEIEPF